MTPYAAPIDSRFMITALSGTSNERNTTSRSRKLSVKTAPMNSGSRWPITSAKSMLLAVWPPRFTDSPVPAVACGTTSSRR